MCVGVHTYHRTVHVGEWVHSCANMQRCRDSSTIISLHAWNVTMCGMAGASLRTQASKNNFTIEKWFSCCSVKMLKLGNVWEALRLTPLSSPSSPRSQFSYLCIQAGFIPPGGNMGGDGRSSPCSSDQWEQARDSHGGGWLILCVRTKENFKNLREYFELAWITEKSES